MTWFGPDGLIEKGITDPLQIVSGEENALFGHCPLVRVVIDCQIKNANRKAILM